MKYGIALLLLVGCAHNGAYINVAKESLPKAVMISVTSEVGVVSIAVSSGTTKVEQSTATLQVQGSGVFITPNGHVLTCAHLLWTGRTKDVMVCEYDGDCFKADVLYREDRLDLALVKVEVTGNDYAKVADPRTLQIGQEVLAIGNPLGFGWSVSHGILSQLHVDSVGVYNMTQSDTFLNPGNSGGPLFNLAGELIGINSRIVPTVRAPVFTGLGFSVQAGQIIEFLARFKGLEKVRRK